jgi:MFS family permease
MAKTTHPRYSLALLTLICTMSYLDRDLLVLFLQSIKGDLGLTDTQLGSLTGIAFGLFYATLGVPVARWADRGNRLTIAALAVALWGVTALCYPWIATFTGILLARIAAGVGEAGCIPPTYSLLGDYFPEASRRVRAMAFFWLAGPVAALLSFIGGAQLGQRYGWRTIIFALAIPAMGLAALTKWTLVEPREACGSQRAFHGAAPRTKQVLVGLWRQSSSRHLAAGIVLIFAMGQGLSPWYGAFMMRSHNMDAHELGLWFGLIFGVAGAGGILLGGYVADRWFASDEGLQMKLGAALLATLFPCFLTFLLIQGKYASLAALVPLTLAFNVFLGPTFAILQRLLPGDMRATALSVVLLVANILGMGVAPQLIGVLSDAVRPIFRADSLRYAMSCFSVLALWAAYHFYAAGKTVVMQLATARE